MKAIIDLPDEVFDQARQQAARRGLDVNQFLSAAVTKMVQASQPPVPRPGGRRVEFPIIKSKGGVLRITADEIAEIEAGEEAEYYARFMRR
jgi:hypothetical protein